MRKWIIGISAYLIYASVVLAIFVPKITSELHKEPVTVANQTVVQDTKKIPKPTVDGIYLKANEIRREYSLPQYNNEPSLAEIANERCNDMATNSYYAHDNPVTGVEASDYIINGIREKTDWDGGLVVGENLASRQSGTSEEFVNDWLGSESHKSALLDPQYTHSGFAVCIDKMNYYIVVHIMANYR